MEGNGISTADSLSISAFVAALAQLIKWAFGDRISGPGALMVVVGLACFGVVLWALSLPTLPGRTWIWGLAQAIISISLQAAGFFGFVAVGARSAAAVVANRAGSAEKYG